jgi:hypothetical protein
MSLCVCVCVCVGASQGLPSVLTTHVHTTLPYQETLMASEGHESLHNSKNNTTSAADKRLLLSEPKTLSVLHGSARRTLAVFGARE